MDTASALQRSLEETYARVDFRGEAALERAGGGLGGGVHGFLFCLSVARAVREWRMELLGKCWKARSRPNPANEDLETLLIETSSSLNY